MTGRFGALLAIGLSCPLLFGSQGLNKFPRPVLEIPDLPPYEIPVCDLSTEQLNDVSGVKGVREVRSAGSGAVIVFAPFGDPVWKDKYKWQAGDSLFKRGPFRNSFGGVKVKDCRRLPPRDDAGFQEPLASFNCRITFANRVRLTLRGYAAPGQGEIEHEMMRDLVGARVAPKQVGSRSVWVARVPSGQIAVWKINRQLFARLEGRWDEALLAACLNRFGSQSGTGTTFNAQDWASVEIGLRLRQLQQAAKWQKQGKGKIVWRYVPYLTDQFPDVFGAYGMVGLRDSDKKTEKWVAQVSSFLMANRSNFRYDPNMWGFVLQSTKSTGPTKIPPQFRDPQVYGTP